MNSTALKVTKIILSGIALGILIGVPIILFQEPLYIAVLTLTLTIVSVALFFSRKCSIYTVFFVLSILAGGVLGAWKSIQVSEYTETILEETYEVFSEDVEYTIVGNIQKQLYQTDTRTVSYMSVMSIDNFDSYSTGSISLFLETPRNIVPKEGSILETTGKIKLLENTTPQGYERYQLYHGGYGVMRVETFRKLNTPEDTWVAQLESWVMQKLEYGFPQNDASILAGILIGNTDFQTATQKQEFLGSGLTHILVVSGGNIAFLLLFVSFFIKYIPLERFGRIIVITSICLFYGTLVGWEVSVIRATCMGLISYFALEFRKEKESISILLWIAGIMSFINPQSLLYDAGFGLSFSATFGILFLSEKIRNRLEQLHLPTLGISTISIPLGAMIGSLPAIIYHFGQFPIFSLFSNILIGWILGPLLALACIYLIVAILGDTLLLYILGHSVYWGVEYILWVASTFSELPFLKIPKSYSTFIALIFLGIYGGGLIEHALKEKSET